MPQELHVVQCYSCRMYQVDIVKKVNKWKCKLCGEKQSLKQVLFQGSGKECRLQVQKLNELKLDTERSLLNGMTESFAQSNDELDEDGTVTQSNWSDFVDEDEDRIYDRLCDGLPSEFDAMTETPDIRTKNVDTIHRGFTETVEPESKRSLQQIVDTFKEGESNVTKVRKVEINNSTRSEWDKFLLDDLSD